MDSEELHRHVAGLFSRGAARTTRVGVEQELLVADAATGAPVPLRRIRPVVAAAACAPYVDFEPGGQLELSLPPDPGPAALGRRLEAHVADLRRRLRASGIRLVDGSADPRPESAVPLRRTGPRYRAMQRHFDAIGPAGRRMMRRTAATQVCLDWWPGCAGLEQWRLLNLAAPFLAAAFATSAGPEGRLATWLAVDPARTGFDDRVLRGPDPVAAYAAFATGAARFVGGDAARHLTTLFPPVRPRGHYLEVRFVDAQPVPAVAGLVAALAGLVYDDRRRRRALRLLEPECLRLAAHWRSAAAGEPATAALGRELLDLVGGRVAA